MDILFYFMFNARCSPFSFSLYLDNSLSSGFLWFMPQYTAWVFKEMLYSSLVIKIYSSKFN